ncbi:hypothetical protein [Amycolatopsis sp. NBRC 101858]|nr:hypothetical protein [Amycolatopsis sp. NBRC 101858]
MSTRTGDDDELPEAPEPANGAGAGVTAPPASGISQPGGDQP